MDNEIQHVNERICPMCGSANLCRVESGDCWCFHTKVPLELRNRIPADQRGKACICRKCVEEFNSRQ
ncbi:cysteine-rich CWC family protein [Paenibacillus sp. NPDC056579]|uniref:cysteine-rich CWC family protein n=1 Tax=Paenibacillus sp. NPDC056579 TaxID=3345871 RepID=UPI00367C9831